jgi:hypothetical protein
MGIELPNSMYSGAGGGGTSVGSGGASVGASSGGASVGSGVGVAQLATSILKSTMTVTAANLVFITDPPLFVS